MAIVGIVGAGVMGQGIAQLFAQSGHEVRLTDTQPGAAVTGRQTVVDQVDRLVARSKVEASARDAIAARIVVVDDIGDFHDCELVIEAIIEDLGAKQSLFAALEPVVGVNTLLVSNTSSLTISAIAAGCRHPERVAGLHFFNPVPLMKVVEIIPGLLSRPEAIARIANLVATTGHRSVVAADQPGFLIDHAGRGLYTEGLRLVEERVADVSTIDRVLRESCGFRMGPFELMDLTGLDVSGRVMQSIYDQFQHEPRFRPSPLVGPRVAAGLFGRKSGRGFYDYADGVKVDVPPPVAPAAKPGRLFVASPDGLAFVLPHATLVDDPANADVILVQPWGTDVTSAVIGGCFDATKTLGVDPSIAPDRRQVLMTSPATGAEAIDLAWGWLAARGAVTVIADSAGFIAQRVLATIVNIACEIAQRGIASPCDIDEAVRIGLGYPFGPLEWGDRIGADKVHAILMSLQALTGDPRYRPSAWLRRRALLGIPLVEA